MPVVPSVSAVTAYASASATKPVTETQLRTGGVAMTDIKYTLSTSAINPDNTNIMYKNGVVYISINSLTIGPWNMSGGSVYIGNIAAGYRPALTVFSIATVYLSTGAYVGDCVIQTDGNITVYRGNMPESVPNSVRFFAQFAYPVN
jgi:hypothetical protein